MNRIPELFGTMVFGDEAMRERLPAHVYESFRRCLEARQTLDLDVADAMATAMTTRCRIPPENSWGYCL